MVTEVLSTQTDASVQSYHQRSVREAIEIEKRPSNFNRENRFKLSELVSSLIRSLSTTHWVRTGIQVAEGSDIPTHIRFNSGGVEG